MAGLVGILSRPRFRMRPLMIVLAALALGLIFLGIVLTIVGHWPGYQAWGGSNPLKYLGPALLAVGVIILVGVVAHCCVMSEREEERDYGGEKKEFVDLSAAPSGENTPSVVVYETDVKQAAPTTTSAFTPYNAPPGGAADADLSDDVNVLKMLKDSPSRERKYPNYNTSNGVKIPTPSFPSETGKKNVGYNSVAVSSDGEKMQLAEEPKSAAPHMQPPNKFVPPPQQNIPLEKSSYVPLQATYQPQQNAYPPYQQHGYHQPQQPVYQQPQQSVHTYNSNVPPKPKVPQEPMQKEKQPAAFIQPASSVPPEGPRRWGSGEKMLDSNGSKTPPRSPKSRKGAAGNPSQGVLLEKPKTQASERDRMRLPALQMPNVIKRARGRKSKGSNSDPSSPTEAAEPADIALEQPDLQVKRTLIVPNKEHQAAKWGTHGRQAKEADLSPVSGENGARFPPGPKESTPHEAANSSREGNSSRDYQREFSDPLGHTSRRERERQSRMRQGGSRERGDRDRGGSRERGERRRDRSSSGHRRHRSRSGDRDPRGRTRDDYYSATAIDYVTGAPVRRSGRSKSQERSDAARYGSTGSRKTRSHDRALNKSYDSDEQFERRHHRGVVNVGYDRGSSDDSREATPRHRPHHLNQSNSTGTSADDFGRSGQITITPSKRKQTMNFTINVNAQPGSAVQIGLGNQPLPPAQPMLPGNTSVNLGDVGGGPGDDVIITQIPHDSSTEGVPHSRHRIRTLDRNAEKMIERA